MIALLTGLWGSVGGYLVAGVAALGLGLTAWLTARKSGQQAQQVADAQQQQKQVQDASKAEAQGNSLDDSTIQRELHAGYDRK